jgi:hypothetical protein
VLCNALVHQRLKINRNLSPEPFKPSPYWTINSSSLWEDLTHVSEMGEYGKDSVERIFLWWQDLGKSQQKLDDHEF